jgi:hypothetical protein
LFYFPSFPTFLQIVIKCLIERVLFPETFKFLFMRKIFLLLLAITASVCLFAQSKKEGARLSFGILGGVTGSTITGDDASYSKLLIGWQAGVLMLADCGTPNEFVFGAEANVSSEGSKYDDIYASGKVVLTYLNVPLVAQLRDHLGFYGEVGVQPGFLLSAKDKYNGNSDDYKDYVNSFDFGIPLGIGYIAQKKVGINLRYIFGVSNMNKGDNAKDHNRVWALRLFYLFP